MAEDQKANLEKLAREVFVPRLLGELQLEQKYCLGYHLRHAFDINSPTVAVVANPAEPAERSEKPRRHPVFTRSTMSWTRFTTGENQDKTAPRSPRY